MQELVYPCNIYLIDKHGMHKELINEIDLITLQYYWFNEVGIIRTDHLLIFKYHIWSSTNNLDIIEFELSTLDIDITSYLNMLYPK